MKNKIGKNDKKNKVILINNNNNNDDEDLKNIVGLFFETSENLLMQF